MCAHPTPSHPASLPTRASCDPCLPQGNGELHASAVSATAATTVIDEASGAVEMQQEIAAAEASPAFPQSAGEGAAPPHVSFSCHPNSGESRSSGEGGAASDPANGSGGEFLSLDVQGSADRKLVCADRLSRSTDVAGTLLDSGRIRCSVPVATFLQVVSISISLNGGAAGTFTATSRPFTHYAERRPVSACL